jgi:tetratricopeptide (TPR) repeat protein
MQDLTSIPSGNTRVRLVLVGSVIVALVFAWFAVRLQLGSMIAELTTPENPSALSAAALAISLAPGDPLAVWLRASAQSGLEESDGQSSSVRYLEDTVRLSPYDYRWRIELGRAYEREGTADRAESELKRAVELAPTYAFAHWHLGNFYLRQNRSDEAFAELRKAAQNNQTYREQVFSLAWDYFDKAPAKVEQLAADTPDAKAGLALFFAARGRASESLRIWNLLTDEQKAANPQIARSIALGLFQQRFFPEALEFSRQLGLDPDARPFTVTNGSFEKGVGQQDDSRFGWQIVRGDSKLDISTDSSVRHEGARSLKVSFRNYIKSDLYNLFQTVVVEPSTTYRLTFWVRTENLKSSGAPRIELVNANDDKVFAVSKPFDTGSNDWQQYQVDFRSPENCTAITMRTARVYCGDQCPIVGMFWYDEFVLNRL